MQCCRDLQISLWEALSTSDWSAISCNVTPLRMIAGQTAKVRVPDSTLGWCPQP